MMHQSALDQPAVFSLDRCYRFLLRRPIAGLWRPGEERAITYLMLNPSVADENRSDRTIDRCLYYGMKWGYSLMYVVTLSPLRSTDPTVLKMCGSEPEDVWDTNLAYILAAAKRSETLVAAYGAWGQWQDRAGRVEAALKDAEIPVWCLGRTKDGYPKHPVRLAKSTVLERYA